MEVRDVVVEANRRMAGVVKHSQRGLPSFILRSEKKEIIEKPVKRIALLKMVALIIFVINHITV